MTKSELRKIYLEKRRNIAADELAAKGQRIANRFFESCDLSSIRVLHCFIPIAKFQEIDTQLIYERIWSDFPWIKTVVPRVDSERGEIAHVAFSASTELTINGWGITEPAGGELIDVKEIDLVIVPLLCFDELGHRVGYGKGFYDKFLSGCRPDCLKVGLSYFPPIETIDDIGGHDVQLDLIVTPERTYKIKEADMSAS
ncbi:MAG TPA: 5-formyltetrahydrofolate cyclo-ligase [Pyrinomonadaceae bacterium]|nr:5-formyltetrahydrofolate cyclo-ligase [Pyrinomonadaceae bacterium]